MTILKLKKKCENIALMLADRETNWDDQQKMKVNLQSTENIENGRKTKDYIKTMLADCKSWSDLLNLLMDCNWFEDLDQSEKIIKT